MEISNILKQTRLKKGISISQLSDITNIKPRSLSYYESGKRSPNSLSKYVILFNALELDIVDVYENVTHFQEECDRQIAIWQKHHARVYNYKVLKKQCYDKISHLKYNRSISDEQYNKILFYYKELFDSLAAAMIDRACLTSEEYENDYISFMYNVKLLIYYNKIDNPLDTILKTYLASEFSSVTFSFLSDDFIRIVGYSNPHKFRKILSGELDIENLSILSALKLCYILQLDFNSLFIYDKNTIK